MLFRSVDVELPEVDAGAGGGGEVEEAARVAAGAVGEHEPAARAEEGVALALARVGGAVPPLLARGAEADVLGHVGAEQPAGDVADEHRREVGPISPARVD